MKKVMTILLALLLVAGFASAVETEEGAQITGSASLTWGADFGTSDAGDVVTGFENSNDVQILFPFYTSGAATEGEAWWGEIKVYDLSAGILDGELSNTDANGADATSVSGSVSAKVMSAMGLYFTAFNTPGFTYNYAVTPGDGTDHTGTETDAARFGNFDLNSADDFLGTTAGMSLGFAKKELGLDVAFNIASRGTYASSADSAFVAVEESPFNTGPDSADAADADTVNSDNLYVMGLDADFVIPLTGDKDADGIPLSLIKVDAGLTVAPKAGLYTTMYDNTLAALKEIQNYDSMTTTVSSEMLSVYSGPYDTHEEAYLDMTTTDTYTAVSNTILGADVTGGVAVTYATAYDAIYGALKAATDTALDTAAKTYVPFEDDDQNFLYWGFNIQTMYTISDALVISAQIPFDMMVASVRNSDNTAWDGTGLYFDAKPGLQLDFTEKDADGNRSKTWAGVYLASYDSFTADANASSYTPAMSANLELGLEEALTGGLVPSLGFKVVGTLYDLTGISDEAVYGSDLRWAADLDVDYEVIDDAGLLIGLGAGYGTDDYKLDADVSVDMGPAFHTVDNTTFSLAYSSANLLEADTAKLPAANHGSNTVDYGDLTITAKVAF